MPRTRSNAQAAQQDARSRVLEDPDLVDIIFKQLDFQSLARVEQCSKAWCAQDKEAAWSALLLQHYPTAGKLENYRSAPGVVYK